MLNSNLSLTKTESAQNKEVQHEVKQSAELGPQHSGGEKINNGL